MSIDLSKLTPAPCEELVLVGSGTRHWAQTPDRVHPKQSREDARFFALARNALDVMMRRGWHPMPDSEKWFVYGECSMILQAAGTHGPYPDPFTALVEADKWYRENVENTV